MGLRLRNGVWHLRKNIDGRRREESTGYGPKDRRKAELAANKIVSRWLDEKHGVTRGEDSEVPTLATWWATYRLVYSAKKVRPERDAAIMDFWLKIPMGRRTWGQTRLDVFKQSDCEAALAHRRAAGTLNPTYKTQRQAVAESTVQRERGVVQSVFERAVDDGLIDRNPWKRVEKEQGEARSRLLMPEEEDALVAVMRPQFKRFVEFVLETGVRLDELRKIERRDVTATSVHVHGKGRKRRTLCARCGRLGGKCRDVPLTAKARQLLVEQMAETPSIRVREESEALWPQQQSRLREVVAVGAERAGIPHLSPHDLRHTFGLRWLQRGGDIYTLSKVLGHSSVVVTEKHYAPVLQTDLDAKMRAVMEPTA